MPSTRERALATVLSSLGDLSRRQARGVHTEHRERGAPALVRGGIEQYAGVEIDRNPDTLAQLGFELSRPPARVALDQHRTT